MLELLEKAIKAKNNLNNESRQIIDQKLNELSEVLEKIVKSIDLNKINNKDNDYMFEINSNIIGEGWVNILDKISISDIEDYYDYEKLSKNIKLLEDVLNKIENYRINVVKIIKDQISKLKATLTKEDFDQERNNLRELAFKYKLVRGNETQCKRMFGGGIHRLFEQYLTERYTWEDR